MNCHTTPLIPRYNSFLSFIFVAFQTCSIDMAMGSLDTNTVNLVPDQLKMTQKLDMPIFCIVDWGWQTNKISDDGDKGISMVVVMKRKITSEMMTTYFPSLLLTAITFATTFFKPFFFEAALSVNLTIMLVMLLKKVVAKVIAVRRREGK